MTLISDGAPIRSAGKFLLTKDLIWRNPHDQRVYCVPQGFVSDGASIPKRLRFMYGLRITCPLDPINIAAYLHDFAFVNNGKVCCDGKLKMITRLDNDRLFYRALIDFNVNKIVASSLYSGVLIGSRYYWPRKEVSQ